MMEKTKEKATDGISVEIIPKPPCELEIEIGHWLLDSKISVIVELMEDEYCEGSNGKGEVQRGYGLHVSRKIERWRFVHVLWDAVVLIYAQSDENDVLYEAGRILEMLAQKLA